MASKYSQSDIERAQTLAKEYLCLLKAWIPKREAAVGKLREIASELDNVQEGVNITKVVGAAVGIVGGLAGLAGIVMTGGLATPLIVGAGAGVVGGLTGSGGEIVGHFISKAKLDEVQKIFDEDGKDVKRIEETKAELDSLTDALSKRMKMESGEVLGCLLVSSVSEQLRPCDPLQLFKILTSVPKIQHLLQLTFGTKAALGKGMTESFAMVSMKGAAKVVGNVLESAAMVAFLAWDVYSIVTTSIEIHNGSRSEAAKSLRKIASALQKQAKDLKDTLDEITRKTTDYEQQIKRSFRERLERISANGRASDEDAETVLQYIIMLADAGWKDVMNSHNINDQRTLVFWISRIFHNIGQQIEQYLQQNDPQKRNHLNITILGHGRIDINPHGMLSCLLYYMTSSLTDITLYEPWGCAIDYRAAYGIVTNRININNVQYTGPVYPGRPTGWNVLPRSPFIRVPTVTFSPVAVGETVHQLFISLANLLQHRADGILIPYFTGTGADILPFPEVPLWVISNTVSLCSYILGVSCSIRVAACLSAPGNVGPARVNFGQYYHVDITNPPVAMMDGLPIEDQLRQLFINLPL